VFAIFVGCAMQAIHFMGLWTQTASTLALVIAATCFSLALGVPLGIWGARNNRVEMVLRSLLDFMQTMPAFVYLIPAVILFGLGRVPAVMATIVFSMPPVVRLTTLGIRQVREELMEAGRSFGSTELQLLWKIQLPNALPSIMAGVNQTIMMALSMVVVASMIGAGGLGEYVLSGIQRLDIGIGFEGGLGVVLLAIVLDRLTESFGMKAKKKPKTVRASKPASNKAVQG
jgi:glycine betaine/proline transport system permease protein